MQDLETRLLFFDINSCGWYKKRTKRVSHDPAQTFNELLKWVGERKTIEETHLFETDNDESELDPIYVYDIKKSNTGNFLVTLWVGTQQSEDNKMFAISRHAEPGHLTNKQVKSQDFGDEYLPGFPHYFWIIPNRDLIISLYFDTVKSGFSRLKTYIKTFIQDCTLPPNTDRENIRETPRFTGNRSKVPSNIENLRQRVNFITQVVMKKNLTMSMQTERDFLTRCLSLFTDAQATPIKKNKILIETKLNLTPTQELFDEIVDHWHEMPEDKIGFSFSDVDATTYLDENHIKGIASLGDIENNEAGILDSASLLTALNSQQDAILATAQLTR